jgi:hypothetical protein
MTNYVHYRCSCKPAGPWLITMQAPIKILENPVERKAKVKRRARFGGLLSEDANKSGR